MQLIEYEWKHWHCLQCGHFGHKDGYCQGKIPVQSKQVKRWVPKDTCPNPQPEQQVPKSVPEVPSSGVQGVAKVAAEVGNATAEAPPPAPGEDVVVKQITGRWVEGKMVMFSPSPND